MRQSALFAASICLNIILAAGCFILFQQISFDLPLEQPAAPVTNTAVIRSTQVKTNVLVRRINFHWSQIESQDYATYIDNLRSIGCPEETIRDIIVADLNSHFARKQREELAGLDMQWWRSSPDAQRLEERQAIVDRIEAERRTLLENLLGPNWDASALGDPPDIVFTGEVLESLPESLRSQVREIHHAMLQSEQEYLDTVEASGGEPNPMRLAEIRYHSREELKQILTPEQLEAYLLRYSDNAQMLREDLGGFEVTPEEFRQLFRLRDQLEQQLQLQTASQDADVTNAFSQQLEGAFQQALSPERYEEYQRYQDPGYQNALAVADAAGLPSDAALSLYQIQTAAEQEQTAIENNQGLSEEEKQEALQAVIDQQQQLLRELLGERNLKAVTLLEEYQKGLEELKSLEAENPEQP